METPNARPGRFAPAAALEMASDTELEGTLARIELAIRCRTNRIEGLRVDLVEGTFRLRGQCKSYYAKQVAIHAAMSVAGVDRLINDIVVETSF